MLKGMFELKSLPIPGAYLIQGKVLSDHRGDFHKKVHREFFEQNGLEWSFAEQFYSVSHRDVIRGMHFQRPPFDHVKLIYCTRGSAIDVLLDLRKSSPTFGQCVDVRLNAGDGQSIYIPKGIAHGFHSLQNETTIQYSVSTAHEPSCDDGVFWNSIPYDWGILNPALSTRDEKFPAFKDLKSPF